MRLFPDVDLLVREPAIVPGCMSVATTLFSGTGTITDNYLQVSAPAWVQRFDRGTLVYIKEYGRTGLVLGTDETGFSLGLYPAFCRDDVSRNLPYDPTSFPFVGVGQVTFQILQFLQTEAACEDVVRAAGLPDFQVLVPTTEPLRVAALYRSFALIYGQAAALDRTVIDSRSTAVSFTFNKFLADRAAWYDRAYERELRQIRAMIAVQENPGGAVVVEPGVFKTRRG